MTMKFSPDALISAGITEKGVVICNFTFGSDFREPKPHRVRIFSRGKNELAHHCPIDDVTLQFPILQDKNFDAMAMVFHAQGFFTQLSQVDGLYRSMQVPYKVFGCTLQGGPSLLWGQVTAELKRDPERLMDLDIEREIKLWIGRVALEQDQLRFYHGLKAMKKPRCFNVLQWQTWFQEFFTMHLTLMQLLTYICKILQNGLLQCFQCHALAVQHPIPQNR
jgi:hypothetical protein